MFAWLRCWCAHCGLMSEKVSVGVAGCGYWGPNLVRNFHQLESAELRHVCDLDTAKLKKVSSQYPYVKATTKFSELLADASLDAVVIATSPSTHHRLALDALNAGKHVLVEKPLTLSSKHARELIDVAKAKRRVLMAGHTFEYTSAVNKLRELITSGELGDVYYAYISRLNLGLFQNDTNVVWDLAPHDVSILLYILNRKPVAVSARGSCHVVDGVEDVAFISILFEGNMLCHLHVSWLDPCKVRQTVVVGSKKMVVYDDVEPLEKLKIYTKGVTRHADYKTFGEFQLSYNYGDIHIPRLGTEEPLAVECKHFIDCIKTGAKPRSSGEVGLAVVRVLEAAEESIKNNGREVKI